MWHVQFRVIVIDPGVWLAEPRCLSSFNERPGPIINDDIIIWMSVQVWTEARVSSSHLITARPLLSLCWSVYFSVSHLLFFSSLSSSLTLIVLFLQALTFHPPSSSLPPLLFHPLPPFWLLFILHHACPSPSHSLFHSILLSLPRPPASTLPVQLEAPSLSDSVCVCVLLALIQT